MKIRGIGGDQASRLAPSQWVNVWEVSLDELEFYDTCQVSELGELATDEYVLEPLEVEP